MKKILKVVAGVALAGCMLLPLAACSDTNDNSEEVKQLQQQIQDLQAEIDSLKNGNSDADLFTGSPKFNYGIDETIPYYINGTKIFDFKIVSFSYGNTHVMNYTVNFIPEFAETTNTVFSAKLYDKSTSSIYKSNSSNTPTLMYFNVSSASEKTIILYYLDQPFACIKATPTQM